MLSIEKPAPKKSIGVDSTNMLFNSFSFASIIYTSDFLIINPVSNNNFTRSVGT